MCRTELRHHRARPRVRIDEPTQADEQQRERADEASGVAGHGDIIVQIRTELESGWCSLSRGGVEAGSRGRHIGAVVRVPVALTWRRSVTDAVADAGVVQRQNISFPS